jgi:hypothetical protein
MDVKRLWRFGQFVDHDITFNSGGLLSSTNLRTPQFDLDSMYGSGPASDTHSNLYEGEDGRETFKIGNNDNRDADLPRETRSINGEFKKFANIPDPRNDENIIVASLHLAFLKLHNKLVLNEGLSFHDAKQTVQWHYQTIVLQDYLRRIVPNPIFNTALNNPIAYAPTTVEEAFIPAEFAGACYRFGHSMVREVYNFNDFFNNFPSHNNLFFQFPGSTRDSHQITEIWSMQGNNNSLERFFDPSVITQGADNLSGGIGIGLPMVLSHLTVGSGSNILALRNLQAGQRFGLPSAQQFINELNARGASIVPLRPEQIMSLSIPQTFVEHTPLWLYTLLEAQIQQNKQRLGQLGGLIVAETLCGLLKTTPKSVLTEEGSEENWAFVVPKTTGLSHQMVDIIRFIDS